jgi:hypothetical protein
MQSFIPDYENEYVRVKYFENIEDAIALFCDKEAE